jgi:alpha-tubulin suppressor-like RCC1 family protein
MNKVASGCGHTMVLASNSSIYVFGDNKFGQLGIGSQEAQLTPVMIESLDSLQVF